MEELEITARTKEEALEKAEKQLGINRDQFEVEVITEGKSGILGIGDEEAVIKVKPLYPPEKDVVKIAKEVLNKLLDLSGVKAEVEVVSEEIPVMLNIKGDDLGILIGRHGQTIASLEYIVKLIVAGQLKAWLPLSIDVGGYRERHYNALQQLALRLAEQVKLRHRAITLEPMPANERRIIHLALADYPEVVTHSIGDGGNRKVVILPKQS
jgi:spoIIIJ-associated protein